MSNPGKQPVGSSEAKEIEGKASEDINPMEVGSDGEEMDVGEEAMMRELVLGLRALSAQEELWDDDDQDNDHGDYAAAAAAKGKASAGHVAVEEKEAGGGKGKIGKRAEGKASGSKKRSKKPKANVAGTSGSGSGRRRKPAELIDTPKGPPICSQCQRVFGSWRAVFGHMRSHSDRQHRGYYGPPTFDPVAEGIKTGGTTGAGVNATGASADAGGSGGGDALEGRARGSDFDLNVLPEEALPEAEDIKDPKPFDLNESPPKEEDPREDQA